MGKDQDLLEACRTGNILAVEKLLAGRPGSKGKGSKASGGSTLSSLTKRFLLDLVIIELLSFLCHSLKLIFL